MHHHEVSASPEDVQAARQHAADAIVDSYHTPLRVLVRALGSVPLFIGVIMVLAASAAPQSGPDALDRVTLGIMLVLGCALSVLGVWLLSGVVRHSLGSSSSVVRALREVRAAESAAPGAVQGPGAWRTALTAMGWPFVSYVVFCLTAAVYYLTRLLG